MKKLYLIMMLISTVLAHSHTTGKLSGKVTDKETGEPLSGANSFLEETILGAAADMDGIYRIINIPPGVYTLRVQMMGYEGVKIEGVRVAADSTTILNAKLNVTEFDYSALLHPEPLPLFRLDDSNKEYSLSIDDAISYSYILNPMVHIVHNPGVTFNFHRSDLQIRGGAPYTNQFLIDKLPINYFSGLYPFFHVGATSIEQLTIIPGGSKAEYINNTGSIINIYYRPKPLLTMTFYGHYQTTHSSVIVRPNAINRIQYLNPKFLKTSIHPDNKDVLLHPFKYETNNLGIELEYIYSPCSYSIFHLQRQGTYQKFNLQSLNSDSPSNMNYNTNEIETWTSKFNYVHLVNRYHQIETGIEYLSHNYNLHNYQFISNNHYFSTPSLISLYLQDRYDKYDLIINLGIRYDKYYRSTDLQSLFKHTQEKFSPRVGIIYPMNDRSKIYTNYGHYYQMPDQMRFEWNQYADPQDCTEKSIHEENFHKTKHLELGYEHKLDYDWLISTSLYHKRMDIYGDWIYQPMDRTVRGVEFGIKRRFSYGLSGSIYYDYMSISDIYVDNIIPLQDFWANSSISYHLSATASKWTLTLLGQYHFTETSISNPYAADYVYCNIKLNREIKIQKHSINLFGEIQNLFNQQNIVETEEITYHLFPRMYNIGMRYQF